MNFGYLSLPPQRPNSIFLRSNSDSPIIFSFLVVNSYPLFSLLHCRRIWSRRIPAALQSAVSQSCCFRPLFTQSRETQAQVLIFTDRDTGICLSWEAGENAQCIETLNLCLNNTVLGVYIGVIYRTLWLFPKDTTKIAFYCADVGVHGFTQSFLLYLIVFFIHFSGHMLWLLGIVVVPRPIEGKSLLFGRKRYLKKFLELNVTRCFDSLGIGNYETGEQSVPFVFRVIKIRGRSKVWRLSEMYNW